MADATEEFFKPDFEKLVAAHEQLRTNFQAVQAELDKANQAQQENKVPPPAPAPAPAPEPEPPEPSAEPSAG